MNARPVFPPLPRRALALFAFPMVAAFLLSGCSLGGSVKPDEYATYTLEFELAPTAGEPLPFELAIEQPVAPDALAGARIATRESDGSYGVLKGARWSERSPDLVQSALVRTFEDSGRLRGVARASSALQSDFSLLVELRAFEADYRKGAAEAHVVLSVKLARSDTREVLATRVFDQSVPVQGSGERAVASAFGQAMGKLAPELRDWAYATGAHAFAPAPKR